MQAVDDGKAPGVVRVVAGADDLVELALIPVLGWAFGVYLGGSHGPAAPSIVHNETLPKPEKEAAPTPTPSGELGDEPPDKALDKSLPANPDELLSRGYKEISHPSAVANGHRTFTNPETGDTIRFDKGDPNRTSHRGRDRYHRENPNFTGKRDQYLDKNGNLTPDGSDAAHLYPGM